MPDDTHGRAERSNAGGYRDGFGLVEAASKGAVATDATKQCETNRKRSYGPERLYVKSSLSMVAKQQCFRDYMACAHDTSGDLLAINIAGLCNLSQGLQKLHLEGGSSMLF